MSEVVAFDQDMIDGLVASAEEDTIESKIENLEFEVTEIKGAVKTLLIDIRETMSVLENPFQNIHGLAKMTGEGSFMSPPIPTNNNNDVDEEVDVEPENTQITEKANLSYNPTNSSGLKLFDPMCFYKTIEWSKEMMDKYDYETIEELVEIFSLLGYFDEKIKTIVLKISSILSKNKNLDDAVIDLYRLYNVLNPEDSSLDSKVLYYMLNECERGDSCQKL